MLLAQSEFPISVIIPTFNRVDRVSRAINSVLSQHFPVSEIILVDDGSTDQTASLIKRTFPQIRYFFQENAGVSAARNLGVRQSRQQWVAFLDDDDEWLPHKLSDQINALQQSKTRLCHTEERWIRRGVRVNQMKKHQKSGGWIFEKCLPLCAMSPSSILMDKTLFDEVGLFREDLPACEDYDMWLKICARYPVAYVERECLIKYGGHDDQLSSKHWGMDRFRIDALSNILRENILQTNDVEKTENVLKKKIELYIKGARKRNKIDEVTRYEKLLLDLGLLA